jgi:hypothetical protein
MVTGETTSVLVVIFSPVELAGGEGARAMALVSERIVRVCA